MIDRNLGETVAEGRKLGFLPKPARNPPLNGLASRREFLGITQADMARVIGVAQGHYHKIEAGDVRLDVHRAAKLAKRLGCSIDELL